ncbi:MAG TPA: serine/threonine-protein kinase [Burkholderiaceae bacterium]
MAGSTKKRGPIWKQDWFVAGLVVVALILVNFFSDFFGAVDRRYYDFASTSTSRQPSDRIAVIAIDDQSIANIGRWPWPRDRLAKMTDLLAGANAKVIGNTVFFFEPQTDRGLDYIRKMKAVLNPASADATPAPAPSANAAAASAAPAAAVPAMAAPAATVSAPAPTGDPLHDQLNQIITDAEAGLDTDAILAGSFTKAGNVVIPSFYTLGDPIGNPDSPLPGYAAKYAIDDPSGFSLSSIKQQQPIPVLGSAVAGIGHLNQIPDHDGAVRQEALLVNYAGKAVPSMALVLAAKSLNINPADIKTDPGKAVLLGKLRIGTDEEALMLPQFYKAADGKSAFPVDSFYDVLTGKIPPSKYSGKIVIIGATAAGVGTLFPTPVGSNISPAEELAHVTSSILNEHFIVEPGWGRFATIFAILAVAAYLIAGLPRLSAGKAAAATAVLFVVLLVAEFGLLSASAIWLKFTFAAALLIIGHLALTTKRFLVTEAGKIKSDEESAETNRMMGLAMQGQGQLDAAFDRFRRVPFNDALMDNLNNLALDFERKRQFNKAQSVYEHMANYNKSYKDLQTKLNRAKNLSETVILGGGGSHAGGTLLLDGGGVEKPMLGRYQVEKELGKGAMGIVYLGKDPKIGRVVAIKTMALSQEFEGGELDDARARFFREAETAGRLQHQNIVTIFDAGEEHDLAYIAMEFIKGKDLAELAKDQKIPVERVLSIVARVADALSYAHRQGVVHRDIKPANIMCDLDADSVKVTDFGIARITDSSKTKTGVILGTPSYMSPEQVAGEKIDGRSDLFSLGVMLYQMLTGTLPFQADSIARLMYKIANEQAPDIRTIRPELPKKLSTIVAFAMNKQAEARYQDGEKFASDLRAVIAEMARVPTVPAAPRANEVPAAQPVAQAAAPAPAASDAYEKTTRIDSPPAFDKTVATRAPEPGSADDPSNDGGTGQ